MRELTLLVLMALSVYAEPFDGWGRVKWGASADQIREAYKADGITDALEMPYTVGQDALIARFVLESGELARVELRPAMGDVDKGAMSDDSARKLVLIGRMGQRVSRLLEEKYGPPAKVLDDSRGISDYVRKWMLDGGTITLVVGFDRSASNLPYVLRVRYDRRNKAMDKL